MKNINAAKGLTKILSVASAILFAIYVFSILFLRTAYMESITSADASRFVLFGLLAGVIAFADYAVGVVQKSMRRQLRMNKRAKATRSCTIIALKPDYINNKNDDFRMIS